MLKMEKIGGGIYKVLYSNGALLGQFMRLEDGYYVFFPDLNGGAWDGFLLQEISSTLYELNKDWDKEVKEYFSE